MTFAEAIENLSRNLLATDWTVPALVARMSELIRRNNSWIKPLSLRLTERFKSKPDADTLSVSLRIDKGVLRAYAEYPFTVYSCQPEPETMRPRNAMIAAWGVRPLCSEAELCRWLDVPIDKLLWLADVNGRERQRSKEALRNYSYRWILKRSSGARLIESPKALLKSIQRSILEDILAQVPSHPAACGFSRGGSIVRHAEGHCHQHSVVKMDLRDFFLSITAPRVLAVFKSLGYPESVARLLAGLCTNSVPLDVMDQYPERMSPVLAQKLRTPHLPQGAPTSPHLANLCAYRMDIRLSALAKRFEWFYSRYADDLLFSGPRQSAGFVRRLEVWAGTIALDERLALNHRKTRAMRRDQRQRACGLILNEKPNVPREDYDALKATLFNCVRHGTASQNRDHRADFKAHLLGKIGFVAQVHAAHGAKLKTLFEKIVWQ